MLRATLAAVGCSLVVSLAPAVVLGQSAQQVEQPLGNPSTAENSSHSAGADFALDDEGWPMRVKFDPGSRWIVGAAVVGRASQSSPSSVGLDVHTAFLGRNAVDAEGEGIRYKLYHRVLDSHFESKGTGDDWNLGGTLYDAHLVRWSEDGGIALPTTPPVRLPFPFAIGFRGELGRVAFDARTDAVEIGVSQAELLVDLWSRKSLRSYAELGIATSYQIDIAPESRSTPSATGVETSDVRHLVAPFTLGTITLHHESENGRHMLHIHVAAGALFADNGEQGATARVLATYEGTLIALNDWPVSAFVNASASADQVQRAVSPPRELSIQSGLRLSAPLD